MQDTSSLYDFAKECLINYYKPTVCDGYLRYDSYRPKSLAIELQQWGDANGYKIKASQVNNSVIVEVAV